MSVMNVEIQPSNVVSTGKISYRSGNPQISFLIGEAERMLLGNSIRFCGDIKIYKNSAEDLPTATDDLNISSKLGVYSILSELILSSNKSKQVCEHIRHYNRFLASYLPNVSSKQEAMGHMNETSCMLPNQNAQRLSVTNNLNANGNSFCIHLPSGLLNNSEPINLSSNNGLGGLMVDIMLSPDSQVLYSETPANSTNYTTAFYELSNVKLICELVQPSPDQLSRATSGTLEYNAISSYYTSIQSTNAIINFNIGLSRVLGAFLNFVPSEHLNNLKFDGLQTLPLLNNLSGNIAEIKQVIFTRDGTRFPLQYNLDTNVKDVNLDDVIVTAEDPQLYRNFANSIMPFMKNKRQQLSPLTYDREGLTNTGSFVNGGQMFGVGVAFDSISGQGVDFKGVNFGINIDCGLTEGSNFPNSAFLFIHSKQTLVFNQNGVQVLS
jgi:hypothetical protein